MVSRRELERAIIQQRIWLRRLDAMEGAVATRLRERLSELTEAIIRAAGAGTNATGPALTDEAHLGRVLKSIRQEYASIRSELNGDYRRLFRQLGEDATRASLSSYRAMGSEVYDRLKDSLNAFNTKSVPGQFAEGRAAWFSELDTIDATLRQDMRKAMSRTLLNRGDQRSLARAIMQQPNFRHENLPPLSRSPERIFGGRLGTNDALKFRAQRLAREEIAERSNRLHEAWTKEAGFELFISVSPLDSRTTDICRRAANQDAMSLEDWDASEFGRAPRHHLCRSQMLAVPNEAAEYSNLAEAA